ncbi:MAG: hypothetical protein MJZ29_08325 [Bacteroidaceae bacterium]|nr:hypothetical protein [Bacteroidaceae bacterium]
MWLFDLFKSKEQRFDDVVTKMFNDAAKKSLRECGGNEIVAGVMVFYSISTVYKELNENYHAHILSGMSRSEYMEIVERVMNKVGRRYLSNWDQMMQRRQPREIYPDI